MAGSYKSPRNFSPEKFWKSQTLESANRLGRPKNQINLIYGLDTDSYQRMVEERRQRTTWMAPWMERLARVTPWTRYRERGVAESPDIKLTALGWCLALGVFACFLPGHFVCRTLLWMPVALYLLGTFGVGDSLGRYLYPVEWVGIVLIVIGLDAVAMLIVSGRAQLNRNHSNAC